MTGLAMDAAFGLKLEKGILPSVFQGMTDAVAVIDTEGRFLFLNSAAERLFGIGEGGLPSANRWEGAGFFRPDQVTAWPSADLPLARALRGEITDSTELFLRNPTFPDGRWLSVTAKPLRDAGGLLCGAFAVFADVSERRRAEEELRAANLRLAHEVEVRTAEAHAMAKELEAFSYSVSHDLRAPLRSIVGFSRALMNDWYDKLDEEGKENLRSVCVAGERMGKLIEGMLALTRISRTELRCTELNLSEMASAIADDFRTKAPQRRTTWKIEPGLTANADMATTRTLIEILFSNAWKFTSKQAEAHIEFGRETTPVGSAFFVRDEGAGFDARFGHKLFKPFQRLHSAEEFPGIGMGLAIAEKIVRRHGGRIWADSSPGHGATFWFTLST